MAISGAHVVCGYVSESKGAKLFKPVWSETIALGQSTTQKAPGSGSTNDQNLVFRVRAPASGEMFAAVGPAADASQAIGSSGNTAREHLIASQEKDIPAQPGDKVSVVTG